MPDSQELLRNSGLPKSALIVVGHEHRLADSRSRAKMVEAVEAVPTSGLHNGTLFGLTQP